MDSRGEMVSVVVHGGRKEAGVVNLPHEFAVRRSPASAVIE